MADLKQIERIIQILQRLALKREVTVSELHRYFNGKPSIRTLQRDLTRISASNIPLVERKGSGKELVWTIEPNFLKFVPMTLGSREIAASSLLKGVAEVFAGTPLERDANAFLAKARQIYSPDALAHIDDHDSFQIFGFNPTGYIDYRPFAGIIDKLIEAISQRHPVVIDHKSIGRDKPTRVTGNPYLLLVHKGAIYLVLDSEKYKRFILAAVQRMIDVQVSPTRFKRDPNFSLKKLGEGRFGIFSQDGQKPERVVLHFSKEIAQVIAERMWHPSQKIKWHKDGSLTLEMKVIVSDELRAWIASWLGWVRVIQTGYRSTTNSLD